MSKWLEDGKFSLTEQQFAFNFNLFKSPNIFMMQSGFSGKGLNY